VTSGIAVDDTLFVELAARTGCPLLTFDKDLIKAFPDIAIRPRDLRRLNLSIGCRDSALRWPEY
jgi:hypothetical protein